MPIRDRRNDRRRAARAEPARKPASAPVKPTQAPPNVQAPPRPVSNPLDTENAIDINLKCHVYVPDTGQVVQCVTERISKSAMLLKSTHPLAISQEVLCLLSNRENLNRLAIQGAKESMKGTIIRVEKEPFLFKVTVRISIGRVNPLDAFGLGDAPRSWWTRHWQ